MNELERALRANYTATQKLSPVIVNNIDCSNKPEIYLAMRSAIMPVADFGILNRKAAYYRNIVASVIGDISKLPNVDLHSGINNEAFTKEICDGLAKIQLYGAALGLPHNPFKWFGLDVEIMEDETAFHKLQYLDEFEAPANLYSRALLLCDSFDLDSVITFVCTPSGYMKMFFIDSNKDDVKQIKEGIHAAADNPKIKENDKEIIFNLLRGNHLNVTCRTCYHGKQAGNSWKCTRKSKNQNLTVNEQSSGVGCYLVDPVFVPLTLKHIGDSCGVYSLDEESSLVIYSDIYTGKPCGRKMSSRDLANVLIDKEFVSDSVIFDLIDKFNAKIS